MQHLRSLIEWWQLAQHPDFTLTEQRVAACAVRLEGCELATVFA